MNRYIQESSKTNVTVFDSSQSSSTQKDMSKTIENFNKAHPEGTVTLVGHSLGADNLVEMVNDNENLKVDNLITLDIADFYDDSDIPSNVSSAVNYYQTNDFPGGEKITVKDPTRTAGVNINAKNSTHRSIDNDKRSEVMKRVSNIIKPTHRPVHNRNNPK